MAANAARAVVAGIPARPGAEPPRAVLVRPRRRPAGGHDAALQHAITAVTNGAYPYGGIDLARLYDGRQEVAATLGARVPGELRHRRAQPPRPHPPRDRAPGDRRAGRPLRLLRAPSGVGSAGSTAAPVRRPVRRAARDRAARRRRSRRALDLHVPPQLDHRRVDGAARPRSGAAPPRRCSRARAASGRPCGRCCATGRPCSSTGGGRCRASPPSGSRASTRATSSSRSTASRARRPRSSSRSRQPSAPDPGPTLSIRLTAG